MILEKHYFLRKQCIFNNCINQMFPVPKEIFSQLSLFKVNLYLKSCIFFPSFYPLFVCVSGSVFRIQIQIQKAPEYGSNTGTDPDPDLDPQHRYKV